MEAADSTARRTSTQGERGLSATSPRLTRCAHAAVACSGTPVALLLIAKWARAAFALDYFVGCCVVSLWPAATQCTNNSRPASCVRDVMVSRVLEGGSSHRGATSVAAMMQRHRRFVLGAAPDDVACLALRRAAMQCAARAAPFLLLRALGSRGLTVCWKLIWPPAERPRRPR